MLHRDDSKLSSTNSTAADVFDDVKGVFCFGGEYNGKKFHRLLIYVLELFFEVVLEASLMIFCFKFVECRGCQGAL